MIRILIVLCGLLVALPVARPAAAQSYSSFSKGKAKKEIRQNPDVVKRGFQSGNWLSSRIVYLEISSCETPKIDRAGERASCQVCSIDNIGGSVSDHPQFLYRGVPLPSRAVGMSASTAHFVYQDRGGWQLRSFEPFGTSYIAPNGHPYLDADLPNLKRILPRECADMQQMNMTIVKGSIAE